MELSIGLPTTIAGVKRNEVLDWARRAEERGFPSLGVLDRLVFPNYEPLIALDNLCDGRLVVGVGIGARDDDYEASGAPVHGRGRRLDAQLEEMKRIWAGEERGYAGAIGPPPVRQGPADLRRRSRRCRDRARRSLRRGLDHGRGRAGAVRRDSAEGR
jgi:alkanesulfonate monooxygenase SsuD/methylene tetrahydromethanopterin reductase-like flavin-dependent oxidoreductase (luciferase family)